ncbi:MAG: porin [Gemmatales bacterium]|nr:porin [Gemmatales bacterium]
MIRTLVVSLWLPHSVTALGASLRLALVICGLVSGLLAFGHTASGQQDEIQELKKLIEKQQRQIERQQQQIEYLQRLLEQRYSPSPTVERQVVEDVVRQVMQEKQNDKSLEKPRWDEIQRPPSMQTVFRDGVEFATSDRAFTVRPRGMLHQDWGWIRASPTAERAILGPDASFDDGAIFRRARLGLSGVLWQDVEYMVEFEFATANRIIYRDLHIGVNIPYVGTLRGGHLKEPYSLESLQSGRHLTFIERSVADGALVERWNPGITLSRTWWDERVTLTAGWFRVQQQSDEIGSDIGDGDYAYALRITGLPLYKQDGRYLVHLGASTRIGVLNERDINPTTPGLEDRRAFRAVAYFIDPHPFLEIGPLYANRWDRYNLEFATVLGPFSIQAEYFFSHLNNTGFTEADRALGSVDFQGFYVYASYFLTGEHRTFDKRNAIFTRQEVHSPLRPRLWFSGEREAWFSNLGAWELAYRYGYLDLTDSGVDGGFLFQYTFGVNWYWNENVKVQWNYERLHREQSGRARDASVDIFLMRLAWEF